MKSINKNVLSVAVISALTLMICQSVSVQASDIDIYKTADRSKITLTMMVDVSPSMGAGANSSLMNDYGITDNSWCASSNISEGGNDTSYTEAYCDIDVSHNRFKTGDGVKAKQAITKLVTQGGCTLQSGTVYRCYSRLTRLKEALLKVLGEPTLNTNISMGLARFSTTSAVNNGAILVPSRPLTTNQIDELKKAIRKLTSSSYTPSPNAYAEVGAYMLGTNIGSTTDALKGFIQSKLVTDVVSGNNYLSPVTASSASSSCRGDGIYFLTDGRPNSLDGNVNTKAWMNNTLRGTAKVTNANDAWSYLLEYSQALNSLNNGTGLKIRTAVVGFGSGYAGFPKVQKTVLDANGKRVTKNYYKCTMSSIADTDGALYTPAPVVDTDQSDLDRLNTCKWGSIAPIDPDTVTVSNPSGNKYSGWDNNGGYGEGGFYPASSSQDVVDSIMDFVGNLKPPIPVVATGSPSIPTDNLNPLQIQPYGYYASFTPKPEENYQLWAGNLNKYHVLNGELFGNDKSTPLFHFDARYNNIALNPAATGVWQGGVLAKLRLGSAQNTDNVTYAQRLIYTNRALSGTTFVNTTDTLNKINLETLFSADTSKGIFKTDTKKNYWLNALGYPVAESATGLTIATLPTGERRQLGANMHSKPILLTQEGKIGFDSSGNLTTTARKDYLLFGTTQGMLHVVEAGATDTDVLGGKEVFAFVPNEIIENQPKGFLDESATSGTKSRLYYGVDGQWTAYSQYVTKTDGTSTVKDSGRTLDDSTDGTALKGLQWVYGGLRMGGRGYYALDLSNMANPSLKFNINPDGAVANSPLSYMGQSWSKPTIAYVNWGGVKKLVMFVGGGYDAGGTNGNGTVDTSGRTYAGYEGETYNQTNGIGAGVYMFDANNGNLLWWANNKVANSTAETTNSGVIATKNSNLNYSVVSQINAIDRNNDGLVDQLYFGDLGGQAFRVDINNAANTTGAFAKRVVRLLNEHIDNTGKSPRFYEMPSFSVHRDDGQYFGVLALSSGNRSSPLATDANSARDGVFTIYDNDVARADLYTSTSLNTSDVTLSTLILKDGVPRRNSSNSFNGGWKYLYSTGARYKGMNEIYALDNMLYVNVFDRDGVGLSGTCNSGVHGDTYLYQFCLPTGKCPFYTDSTILPNRVLLGAGILGAGIGQSYTNSSGEVGLLVNNRDKTLDCTSTANKNKPECQVFSTKVGLKQLRWYESR